ncbi:hypothetical protein GCK32_017739, partial [Trichostrongylus colubriformis]
GIPHNFVHGMLFSSECRSTWKTNVCGNQLLAGIGKTRSRSSKSGESRSEPDLRVCLVCSHHSGGDASILRRRHFEDSCSTSGHQYRDGSWCVPKIMGDFHARSHERDDYGYAVARN